MKISHTLLWISVVALLISSCKKDDPGPDDMAPLPTSGISISVTGRVLDQNGAFLPSASIRLNGRTATSDANGIFRMTGVPANEGRNFLRVDKDGYFFAGRNFHVDGNGEYRVQVALAPRALVGSFQASAGGTVQTADGLQVVIPANGIEGGYQGEVKVYARYLDPTLASTIMEIPGLEAINSNDELGLMRSYSMGHIELQNGSGERLQLAAGTSAALTFPVPSGLQSEAPATIPLWYFDEVDGVWREEGSATLQGGQYTGNVEHFTLWNCDDFNCSYSFNLTISCGGAPVRDMPVIIRGSNFTSDLTGTGCTNDIGKVSTMLPCNALMKVYVVPPGGNGAEYLMGTIQTSITAQDPVNLSLDGVCGPHASVRGRAVNGAGVPVSNGYMYLRFDDFYTEPVFFDAQGNFSATFFDYTPGQLATGAELIAWDLDNFAFAEGPTIQFNDQLTVLSSPIVIGGSSASIEGRIYTGGFDDYTFYCLDAADGSVIWSFDAGFLRLDVSPVVSDSKVYFLDWNEGLYCLNAIDGSEIWSNSNFSDSYSPFVENGILYSSSNYGRIRAIDATTGAQLWVYDSGGSGIYSAPTIVGNTLYCGGNNANPGMLALNKTDGTLLWRWDAPDDVNTSPCVANGKVFFGCINQQYYALDASTGTLL